ncbi:putative uncharacterized protein [Clostridium sp. CAG:343]|jgi:glycosyltransferase involved in cell wall biosynthesis|nr:putative uncharacterized protein [Clostridium sp. CAG:343]HCF34531.1 hypothetical protein [Clostridiales bacterium]
MKIQVLVATMYQKNHTLLKKMNIKSNAIIGNQCNCNGVEKFKYNEHDITYLNFNEKGVGLNRNNALMRATGDICLFADDDMIYKDNYVEIVEKAFNENPKADVLIFNLIEKNPRRYIIKKKCKINYFNYMRYGTARIAVKLKSIKENGIYFNQCFGGGTEHCHGEDNLFLTECLNKKLNIYAIPEYIATLTEERESTWEQVTIDKYLEDQGYLYKKISPRFYKVLCLQNAIKRRKFYGNSIIKAYLKMLCGSKK